MTKYILKLWLLTSLISCMISCVQEAETPETPNPPNDPPDQCLAAPTCAEGQLESTDPCGDDEDGCREVTECDSTIYCRPEATDNCLAIPVCDDAQAESTDPCGDDEEGCQERTECGSTIYCRDAECPDSFECPEDTLTCAPEDPVDGCDPYSVGEGACATEIYCRSTQPPPPEDCLAVPTCIDGEQELDEPCLRGDPFCTDLTECGFTISCYPENVCLAEATCQMNQIGTQFACESEEDSCEDASLCGTALFCRRQAACDAIPVCPVELPQESNDPCLARETVDQCRAVTECATTIACRAESE
jgi:hypothetical protein